MQVDAARLAAAQAHLQQRAALEESALPIMLDTMVRPGTLLREKLLRRKVSSCTTVVLRSRGLSTVLLAMPLLGLPQADRQISRAVQWAANVIDIERTLDRVCHQVIGKSTLAVALL